MKLKVKKGDTVIVVSGKDRGKTGTITRSLPREGRVLVEGINIKKKHQRARRGGQKGQVVEKALPVDVSTVMLVDPKTGTRTRIGRRREGATLVRFSRKSGIAL